MKYIKALTIAEKYKKELEEFCSRVEIVGSIRRKKREVKDVEIVAIPICNLTYHLGDWLNQFKKVKGKFPCKYTQIELPEGIKLDIFFADRHNWGLIYAIRTGSADFSHLVLARGWVEKGYKSRNGNLHHKDGSVKYIREERELFDLIELDYIEPEKREVEIKMKIGIELENPQRCDGCPLLKIGDIGENSYCRLFGLAVAKHRAWGFKHDRPKECIKENGE